MAIIPKILKIEQRTTLIDTNEQYQQQQTNHFILSNSNPNLNQYSQQPGATSTQQSTMSTAVQLSNGNAGALGGPIYVTSNSQGHVTQGIPTSASANSVVYASQSQLGGAIGGIMPHPPPMQQQQPTQQSNGPPAPPPPNGYGQMNGGGGGGTQVPMAPPMMQAAGNVAAGVPMPPPLNRMSSTGSGHQVPVAPPPPPAFGGFNGAPPPPQPPAPPAPPAMLGGLGGGAGAPPPPPPPPMSGLAAKKDDPQQDLMGSLAAQLQQAKLKKKGAIPQATENSGSSTSSGGSGNYGTIGRTSNGMASMMDEMAKTLARRRAQAEKKEPDVEADAKQRPWEKSNTLPHKLGSSNTSNGNSNNANSNNTSNSGGESPRPMRKRFGSASEETILKVNGDGLSLALSSSDLDTLKAEIVKEMRLEIQKVKQEIIEAIKSEFNRR